jgi:NCS1 family nucleobase:cation symporter-1
MSHRVVAPKRDPGLYNADLAPIEKTDRKWGAFEIFNVWANDVQSLFGYTLAASLFLTYGLNGWAVFSAILLAGFFVMWLVNLVGKPSVEYGIPFPVFARASMGVRGANFPAMLRGVVAIFWFGAQTYFASTAVALLLNSLLRTSGSTLFLGMTGIDWVAFLFVWAFQMWLFWHGMDWIRRFLNCAGPFVYAVMIALAIIIVSKSGSSLFLNLGDIFKGTATLREEALPSFFAVFGTMVAYFSAVVINYGDFSRFVEDEAQMKKGNLWGLPGNIAFFSLTALIITAGTVSVFGQTLINPTDIVARVNSLPLTIVAAIMFFAATVGINLVANFIPPAYDLANLRPEKINFRKGGLITSAFALLIGGFWVALISKIGILQFVNTLGVVLSPVYGIMMVDYYVVKNGKLDIEQLFCADPSGLYYYERGWNRKALLAFALAAMFSIATVWIPLLGFLSGFSWIMGAALGALIYLAIMK